MKPTDEMIEAEDQRLDLLRTSRELLDAASRRKMDAYGQEQFVAESIKCLMIGSHSGRIG